MKAQRIAGGASTTYVAVLAQGEEAFSALADWAASQAISAAQVTAVGAFARATVGWFDRVIEDYQRIEIDEQCEVLSLIGDIALGSPGEGDGQPQPHLHAVLGLRDGTTRGGHLLAGIVWPTLEAGGQAGQRRPDSGGRALEQHAPSASPDERFSWRNRKP